jgi:hypothetical protein
LRPARRKLRVADQNVDASTIVALLFDANRDLVAIPEQGERATIIRLRANVADNESLYSPYTRQDAAGARGPQKIAQQTRQIRNCERGESDLSCWLLHENRLRIVHR